MKIILTNTIGISLALLFAFAATSMIPQFASANTDVAAIDAVATDVTTTENSTTASLLATLQSLIAMVEDLKAQLALVQGQVQALLGDNIRQGVSNDDVKTVQELLATDPSIYPEGYTTGYFGPLTKKAIERFQEKNSLTVTGEIDDDTKSLMENLLENDDDNDREHVSEGLLMKDDVKTKARKMACEVSQNLCLDNESDDGSEVSDTESSDDSKMSDNESESEVEDGGSERGDNEGGDDNAATLPAVDTTPTTPTTTGVAM